MMDPVEEVEDLSDTVRGSIGSMRISPNKKDLKEREVSRWQFLAWRLDPQKSFSDWKVEVTRINGVKDSREGKIFETYHVHRCFLGAGPRQSDYFNGVFQANNLEESQSGVSRFDLEESAADAFPAFLDYIYSFNDVDVTTESAVALRHLGNYFGVSCLFNAVSIFIIEQDLNEENVHIYCAEALLYHDLEIVDACMKMAAKARQDLLVPMDTIVSMDDASPAQMTMQMLSMQQQNQLLLYALQHSADECTKLNTDRTGFKRIPVRWKQAVFTTNYQPTVMPTSASGMEEYTREGYVVHWKRGQDVFKACPIFYYDEEEEEEEEE
jgi:hypothetical protein